MGVSVVPVNMHVSAWICRKIAYKSNNYISFGIEERNGEHNKNRTVDLHRFGSFFFILISINFFLRGLNCLCGFVIYTALESLFGLCFILNAASADGLPASLYLSLFFITQHTHTNVGYWWFNGDFIESDILNLFNSSFRRHHITIIIAVGLFSFVSKLYAFEFKRITYKFKRIMIKITTAYFSRESQYSHIYLTHFATGPKPFIFNFSLFFVC